MHEHTFVNFCKYLIILCRCPCVNKFLTIKDYLTFSNLSRVLSEIAVNTNFGLENKLFYCH